MNKRVIYLILASLFGLFGYISLFVQDWKIAGAIVLIHWGINCEQRAYRE